MTADRRAALVERIARAMCAIDFDGDQNVFDLKNNSFRYEYEARASAALDLALEEAAKICDEEAEAYETDPVPWAMSKPIAVRLRGRAAAIRALKGKP